MIISGQRVIDKISKKKGQACSILDGRAHFLADDGYSVDLPVSDLEPVRLTESIQPQDVDCRLPVDAKTRKSIPLCTGLLDYFPDALAAVAEVSRIGNEQHNPGQPLHWERGKSNDQEDCLLRHLVDRGKIDTDGARHSAKVAWRALAMLQLEIEKARGQ